jgi:hypothetical protein
MNAYFSASSSDSLQSSSSASASSLRSSSIERAGLALAAEEILEVDVAVTVDFFLESGILGADVVLAEDFVGVRRGLFAENHYKKNTIKGCVTYPITSMSLSSMLALLANQSDRIDGVHSR